jgi:formylglycine-generating enzyme required for sulfatase activity
MGIEKKPVLKEEISRGEERTVEAGENMVHVKGGCFKMVCSNWALYCDSHFMPKHEVCVEDFHIDKHEITQKAYRTKMGKNPSYFKGDNNPVVSSGI